jgi:hypothetical protein
MPKFASGTPRSSPRTIGVDAHHAVDRAQPDPARSIDEAGRHAEVRLRHASLLAEDDRREYASRSREQLGDLGAMQDDGTTIGCQPDSPVCIGQEP